MERYLKFVDRFATDGTILIDGATGTEAERRGVPQLKNAWNGGAALSHPEILIGVHKDYIKSGSEIIISNTFANTKHALEDAGLSNNFEKYNLEGVRLAIETRNNARVTVYEKMGKRMPRIITEYYKQRGVAKKDIPKLTPERS